MGEIIMFKKMTAAVLALIMALSCLTAGFVFAGAADEITVTAGYEAESEDALQTINWYKADGEYYFFIPSYWDSSEVKLWAPAGAKINGEEIIEGEAYDLGEGGTIAVGGSNYSYKVVSSSGVGTVFITTESGSLDSVHADKNYKEAGQISILNEKGKEQTETRALSYIKGRGNASWKGEKKPYNIKLDKKAKLLGMAKSKKWSLIANEEDISLMRNAVTYSAAADAGLAYSPKYAPVDLYVNNEYLGSYLLTTRIEPASDRVDVENLDDINEEIAIAEYGEDFDMDSLPQGGTYGKYAGILEGRYKYVQVPETEDSTTDGGYIIEMEIANRYINELSGFVSNDGQPVTMKSPEYASEEQIKFISDYYQRVEDAIKSSDGVNGKGESYKDLIDVESFARYYDISEWTTNMDTGLTSTYFYIDTTKDGKLYAGPVWDYDIAFGNNTDKRFGLDYTNPEGFTVCFGRQYRNTIFKTMDVDEKPNFFGYLCSHEDFAAECKTYWDDGVYEAVTAWYGDEFDGYADTIADSAVMNHVRRNTFGTRDVDEVREKYAAEVASFKNFASAKAEFMNENLGTVQENPVKTFFLIKILKKAAVGINNFFEKTVLLFKLENRATGLFDL